MEIANVRTEMSRELVSGLPAQQAGREMKLKAQTRPVENSAETAQSALDEKRLRQEEAQPGQMMTTAELEEMMGEMQDRLDMMGTNLQFAMDREAESIVVRITDKASGEIIRQIPSEDVVRLRKKLEELTGLLFDGKA